ncbi:GNAT family N-acetyltransferase [Tumebacillus flagellatus]|uniref:N-acetyltransferase domain-containing protein n=1 Tax=Tumebacillus flagellatus TaxID=1157490 RepID=A0A074LRQ2_9BACL|nr:GNAT family N-acetyltransferase [Tumebacillus flagellatus]KEO84826.1 hypothetical protein EL26_02105 [Tumebacillus flagellatus]
MTQTQANILIRSACAHELPHVLELIEAAFTQYTETPDEANGRSHAELFSAVYQRSDLDLDLLLVAEDTSTGQLLSMASFLPKPALIGERDINGVILSPVGTLPDCRGQGIAESVLRFGLQLAKEKGYAFSCVLGHPDYYPRVGYVQAFPWYRLNQTLPQTIGAGATARPYEKGDEQSLSALYNTERDGFFLKPNRTLSWWETELAHLGEHGRCFSDLRVFEQNGEIIGYASLGEQDDKLLLKEAHLLEKTHAPAVLNALYTLASERGKASVEATFPASTALGLQMKLQGATETVHAPSAWMMQVLDWEAWLEAYAIQTGMEMLVSYDEASQQLYVDGELQPALRLAPDALTKLSLGLFTVDELQALGQAALLQEHHALTLQQLFPKRSPYFNLNESLF